MSRLNRIRRKQQRIPEEAHAARVVSAKNVAHTVVSLSALAPWSVSTENVKSMELRRDEKVALNGSGKTACTWIQ